MRKLVTLVLALAALGLVGCGDGSKTEKQGGAAAKSQNAAGGSSAKPDAGAPPSTGAATKAEGGW